MYEISTLLSTPQGFGCKLCDIVRWPTSLSTSIADLLLSLWLHGLFYLRGEGFKILFLLVSESSASDFAKFLIKS